MLFNDREIDKKVKELMKKMTVEEKGGQMVYIDARIKIHEEMIRSGKAGTVANAYGAEDINELQKIAVNESRLGIPLLFGNDIIHGYKTIFPIPLAESCSWDTELIERTSKVAAREAAAAGTRWIYSPMLDIARDPRWGRIYEGAGEDTYLGSVIGAARIRGLKSNNDTTSERVISCIKHFAAYGACEGGRDYNTVDMSENELREVYLPPFKACIDAGAETVMTSYNTLNGIPSTANKKLVTGILRNEWGFDGIVVNDYYALLELLVHGVAATPEEACRLSIDAGVDMDMNSGIYSNYLPELIEKGFVNMADIDKSVYRVLYFKYWLGLFDNPYAEKKAEKKVILCQEHLNTAREAARKAAVLLKNEKNLLPLNKEAKVAVIGPLADDRLAPIGWWHCDGDSNTTVTVLEGIKNKLNNKNNLVYEKGCEIEGDSRIDFSGAVEAARKAEVAVVVVGESMRMSGESRCRASLGLPGIQEQLLKAVYETGTPVVAVLINGRPLCIPWMADNIPAILEGWLSGIQSGNALADILFGDCCPGGKLTATFPRSVGQIPVHYNHRNTGRPAGNSAVSCLKGLASEAFADSSMVNYSNYVAEGLHMDSMSSAAEEFSSRYLDEASTPLYPFGYGLSYTTFNYSGLRLSKPYIKLDETLSVKVQIKNTGKMTGEEIVQLYVQDVAASLSRPVKELKGYQKISLLPGEEKTVEFGIRKEQLAFYNKDLKFEAEPGIFKIWVGPDSSKGLESFFELKI